MRLALYKNLDFDGVNTFPNIGNKATFDAYLAIKEQYSQPITFNRIGDPILLHLDYDTAMGYGYGCLDTGTKKYFIVPDAVTVNENNRVFLSYSVDWLTTLTYDNEISFGRSHLIKSTDADPLTYPQGIQPIDMLVSSSEKIKFNNGLEGNPYNQEIIVIYTEPDAEGTVRWAWSPMNDGFYHDYSYNRRGLMPDDIYDGMFLSLFNIPPDNVLAVFFVPAGFHNISSTTYTSIDYAYANNTFLQAHISVYTGLDASATISLATPITTDSTKAGVITDTQGTIIYTVPYGRTITSIKVVLHATLSQCYIELIFNDGTDKVAKRAENSSILFSCDRIDYISDAYKNWSFGMKGIEIEERRIQKNKNLVSGIGNSVITGTIGGATGSPIGAAAGVVGGIASAVLSYATDTYYESKVNVLEDRKYQLTQDTMIPGSFVEPGFFHAIQLEAPASDIARYDAELLNFGADCNLPVTSWAPVPGSFKFADVEIIADVPYSIKQNIRQKLLSGIKIVSVT